MITSYGYDGTVIEAGWAKLSRYLGLDAALGSAGAFGVTVVTGVDRTVRVATGEIYKSGVLAVNDANADVQASTLASGTRWDTLVVRRDWQTNTTSLVIVAGTATKQLAGGLNASPGTIEDQPIALLQITAGQQAPTAVIDLRPLTVSGDRSAVGTEKFWPATGALPEGYVDEDGQALDRVKHAALFAIIGTTYGAGDGSTTFNVPNAKGRVLVGFDAAQAEFDSLDSGAVGGAKTHTLTAAETPAHAHDMSHGHGASSGNTSIWHQHDFGHSHGRHYGNTYGGAGNHSHGMYNAQRSIYAAGGSSAGIYAGDGGNNTKDAGAHDHAAYIDIGHMGFTTGASDPTHSHGVTVNSHSGNTSSVGSGAAHNNLQPYGVRRVIIKAL